uniref:AAA+ ATPase domain-containing protein n=1 Tax=Bicosoecida sp. CB-2014 TaxID=1486930 RepID=A0A7S1G4F5_9STRA
MLARAVAGEAGVAFLSCAASDFVEMLVGRGASRVRDLFRRARAQAPCILFIDELDALMGQRGSDGASEHEASRRMKTELLIQMDGLAKTNDLVFLLAASNLPWELDVAMLRRLEKRVHVPLPGKAARSVMLSKKLPPGPSTKGIDYDRFAEATEGYSGSDITLLAKEAAMQPLRRIMKELEALGEGASVPGGDKAVQLAPVENADVEHSLSVTRPSAHLFADKYIEWQKEFGSR